MLMTKGLDLKILYTILIAVSGIVLTIGAASALMVYAENLEVDNQTGDSSIKITSSTGASKLILEDQGVRTWSVTTDDNGKSKLQIWDETLNKPRLTIKKSGQVGIGTAYAQAKLHVQGTLKTTGDANFLRNLNVDGDITGSYIANLEATILDLQTRLAALEASMAINEPMIVSNEAMISTHDITLTSHDAMILSNQADIATNAAAISEGGGGPNACDPDGDGFITPQEMLDYMAANGGNPGWTFLQVFNAIGITESNVGTPVHNDMLDTDAEITDWNLNRLIPDGVPICPLL